MLGQTTSLQGAQSLLPVVAGEQGVVASLSVKNRQETIRGVVAFQSVAADKT